MDPIHVEATYGEDPHMARLFDIEEEVFQRVLPSFLEHEGEYLVIKGETVAGPFATFQAAMAYGHEKYPDQPFYGKEIEAKETVYFVSGIRPA